MATIPPKEQMAESQATAVGVRSEAACRRGVSRAEQGPGSARGSPGSSDVGWAVHGEELYQR